MAFPEIIQGGEAEGDLTRLQLWGVDLIRELKSLPLLLGKRLVIDSDNGPVATTVTVIKHSLGRVPVGFFVIDTTTAHTGLYRDSTGTLDAVSIPLIAVGASFTGTLWIF